MLKQGQSRNYITKGIFEPLRRPFPFSFGSVLYFLVEDLGVGKFLRWKNKIKLMFLPDWKNWLYIMKALYLSSPTDLIKDGGIDVKIPKEVVNILIWKAKH